MFNGSVATKFILEFTIGVASSFLIVSARNMNGFSKLLNLPTIKWLGKVSYSLYLIHLPIAFFLFRALLGKTAFANIVILVICTSLACSEIFYQLVERPSIRLGMALSKRIE
jgi:peptidoglycan/LPS O-acetylase OafA/YrhL